MKAIAISGNKGGTGKTSLSHALALGAAWHDVLSVLCHTDNRKPMYIQNRPYLYYDASEPDSYNDIVKKCIDMEGLFIVDGGGNRETFDKWIAGDMDLILIPVVPDPEDVKQALSQYDILKDAGATDVVFIVNKYPSNIHERKYISKYIDMIPEDKIIGKIPEVRSIRMLREDDLVDFQTPTTKINNLSRKLYRMVTNRLNNRKR